MSYDPALPYLSVPLYPGEVRSSTSVTMRRLADGQSSGRMQVTQVTEASSAPAGQWLTGAYARAVQLRTERTVLSNEGNLQLSSVTLLVPGIGEVKSEGGINGVPAMRRTLACGTVANRSVGDCRVLFPRR